jgi:hypothetical protein
MIEVPFDITGNESQPFEEEDPFNPGNVIKGYLFRRADYKYGMLYITYVNGKPAEQLIWTTPKMHYPMDRQGIYSFSNKINNIEVYEKLDGTNILAYIYHDYDGRQYVTYKTRLRPVLKDGKFGRFESLWREMLEKYPNIPYLCLETGFNVSWELYGKRNKVLIDYPESLEAKVLFIRNNIGKVYSPSYIEHTIKELGLKMTTLITTIDGNTNLELEYIKIVEYLNGHIKVTQQEGLQDIIEGMEGSVWYAISADGILQYKCKPDIVKDIHFAASEGIPNHSIYITCVNAFEETDIPDMAYIKKLLLEEFPESEIERKWITIQKTLDVVTFNMKLKYQVVEEYNKHPEFDIIKNKGQVMRHFASAFDKKQSRAIFKLLNDEFVEIQQ